MKGGGAAIRSAPGIEQQGSTMTLVVGIVTMTENDAIERVPSKLVQHSLRKPGRRTPTVNEPKLPIEELKGPLLRQRGIWRIQIATDCVKRLLECRKQIDIDDVTRVQDQIGVGKMVNNLLQKRCFRAATGLNVCVRHYTDQRHDNPLPVEIKKDLVLPNDYRTNYSSTQPLSISERTKHSQSTLLDAEPKVDIFNKHSFHFHIAPEIPLDTGK
jgi:hypothetical protein